jgi:hypothetical protein
MFNDELHTMTLSEDGSYTAYSKEYDEHYHSTKDGALHESMVKHVLLKGKIMNLKAIQSSIIISGLLVAMSACNSNETNTTLGNDGSIKKTGQTKSYNADAIVISDKTLYDDGFYKKGIEPRYSRDNVKEIVTDILTGLEWQDSADVSLEKKNWLNSEVYAKCIDDYGNPSCPDEGCDVCNDTSGDTAIRYCLELELDGGGWRLPSLDELFYIVDKGAIEPSIDPVFKNVQNSTYFSSTILGSRFLPVAVDFNEGYALKSFPKMDNFRGYVLCVRGDENSSLLGTFTRDSQGIVTSSKTKLQWQDNYETSELNASQLNWEDAINYCEALDLNGSNWRLPNINELSTIINHQGEFDSIFVTNGYDDYWSSTTYKGAIGGVLPGQRQENNVNAWILNVNPNDYYFTSGTDKRGLHTIRTRCVRDFL